MRYIALHIGSQVDSIKSLTTKLNCILICPEFYALSKKLLWISIRALSTR